MSRLLISCLRNEEPAFMHPIGSICLNLCQYYVYMVKSKGSYQNLERDN
jgi:hypothetical protein